MADRYFDLLNFVVCLYLSLGVAVNYLAGNYVIT